MGSDHSIDPAACDHEDLPVFDNVKARPPARAFVNALHSHQGRQHFFNQSLVPVHRIVNE